MQRWRDARGQASSEYVALVALVAVVLTLAAGLTSGGVGGQVLAGIQRGLCRVAAVECMRPQPARADLAACPVERTTRSERLGTTIAVVRLGTRGTLGVVRASDGRVTVTLSHGNDVGAEVGLGARATAAVGATWTSGRSWTFPGEIAARRFVAAYGRKATIGGQLLDGVRSRCSLLCDALGWRPHAQLPEPDEIYAEAGPGVELTAAFGAHEAGVEAGALLGRQISRDGSRTWYLQLDATATASLGLPGAELAGAGGGRAVLAYTFDAARRPRALRVSLAGELGGSAAALHAGGRVAEGRAAAVELDATLDLREPANRAAAAALLDALADPRELPGRADALGRRIRSAGQVDRRLYGLERSESGLAASLALGPRLAGALDRSTEGVRLLRAETRLPGLPFLPRDDCRRD